MAASEKDDAGKKPRASGRKKPLSPHYQANNKGGYGNPPVKDQFGPNNPGGPGRPRGSGGITAAMKKMLRSKVPLADGRQVPFPEALGLAARKAILSNGIKGIELGLRLDQEFGTPPPPQPPEDPKCDFSMFNDLELELLESLFTRALGQPAAEEEPSPFGKPFSAVGPCIVTRRPDGHLAINPAGTEPPFLSE